MFVFQGDTFDMVSHHCLLPSCSGVASKTLRTHLRLSTLARLRWLSGWWAKLQKNTKKKLVEQDMSSHRFPTKASHIHVYIYIYMISPFRRPLQTTIFLQNSGWSLIHDGTSHRSQGMSPSRWWDQSTNVHGQKHPTSPAAGGVKLWEVSRF